MFIVNERNGSDFGSSELFITICVTAERFFIAKVKTPVTFSVLQIEE